MYTTYTSHYRAYISSVWMKYAGGNKYIQYWVETEMLVLCMPLWTERIDASIPHHKCENWVIFSQRPPAHNNQPLEYNTQSAWWYMLKQTSILNNEWEIWRKLYFCNMAVWTKVCTDRKQWKLGDIFNLTQQSTLLQRYLRDERSWWITEIQLVPWIMIMTEQHRSTVYFYRSMYVGTFQYWEDNTT